MLTKTKATDQEIAAKATSDAWRKLKKMAEEWGNPELKTHGDWNSKGLFSNVAAGVVEQMEERKQRVHSEKGAAAYERWVSRNTSPGRRWDVSGDWVKGPQNFREIAKSASLLAGYKYNVEESCDWLMEHLAHFLLERDEFRKEVGLLSDNEQQWAFIEHLFKALAIFFHELEILAPTPESEINTKPPLSKSFISILKSKATLTAKEVAVMHGVDESTIRKSWVGPNGPLKIAEGTKRITSQSVADHAGVSLEDK